jgi:peptidoglycan/xylan/chitin deacetylase (PgdA/CDA1 family)
MYHRISEDGTDSQSLCVPPSEFAEQMRALKSRGYEVLNLEQVGAAVRGGTLPARFLALTFDDGYVDNLTCAAPILAEHSLPATFFIVTETLVGAKEFWWDTLHRALLSAHTPPSRLAISIRGTRLELPTATDDERQVARNRVRSECYGLGREARDELILQLMQWSGLDSAPCSDGRAMTSAEIRKLDEIPGMRVGSHTHSHLLLISQSYDVQMRELRESRSILEALLGHTVTTLCYPYGGAGPSTVRAAHETGYQVAVAVGNTSVVADSIPLALPRHAVRRGDSFLARIDQMLSHA